MTYAVLLKDFQCYDKGDVLRDVTLREARAMECNQCGDCCNGLRDGVRKDEKFGMPLLQWGSNAPADLYESRYGQRMLLPIVMGDGGPDIGDAFEIDVDGNPYTSFACAFLVEFDEGVEPETRCGLYNRNVDPTDPSANRPYNCGAFPVFGQEVDDAILAGNTFVPPTGALPRCTWYGIRITGPWKDTDNMNRRWDRQQREKVHDD